MKENILKYATMNWWIGQIIINLVTEWNGDMQIKSKQKYKCWMVKAMKGWNGDKVVSNIFMVSQ